VVRRVVKEVEIGHFEGPELRGATP